jgi:hypothetical protein
VLKIIKNLAIGCGAADNGIADGASQGDDAGSVDADCYTRGFDSTLIATVKTATPLKHLILYFCHII